MHRNFREPVEQVIQGYPEKIEAALASVRAVAMESPLEMAPLLSERLGNHLFLKREDLQSIFSFKIRGAYNKMVRLSPAQLQKGVVTASAGNHAQGVALSAQKLRCRATIVMPVTTPAIKVKAVARRGATVVLFGESYAEASQKARELESSDGLVFVHPYDDPDVIAGQGTIGLELLSQSKTPMDAVFVGVGGGGLIAGIAAYLKHKNPAIKIIGVQPEDADAMDQSLKKGERVILPHVGLFADGVAVKQVGEETFRLCRSLVDEIIRVDTDDICAAIKDVFDETRSILEPAGALAIAGAKAYVAREGCRNQTLVSIACGANMNFERLRFVSERAEVGEQREALFAVTIPEQPGSFRAFCRTLGAHNVTEFNYRYADARAAHVFVGVELSQPEERETIRGRFEDAGFSTVDLTHNEMAKLHIRHLVGGRAPQARDEIVYRFEFPERPGALLRFLEAMSPDWNISLFHYRNHGDDYGRVLVGMQVPTQERDELRSFLNQVGYPFVDETDNPAYRLFL